MAQSQYTGAQYLNMNAPNELDLKQRMRAMWTAGDFGKIASQNIEHAREFAGRLEIRPGIRVLDVACGTGNLALPVAALGAHVTGVDIAPNLLEQARARASEDGLEIRFDEGDAEELPYENESFDLVVTMYGAMFAPFPDKVASELARVCKSGGQIAMANWTPSSFPAKVFALGTRYAPAPLGVPPAFLWGEDSVLRERLRPYCSDIRTARRPVDLRGPVPPHIAAAAFAENLGPIRAIADRLDPAGRAQYRSDLEKLWSEHNEAPDGTTFIRGEYLEVIASRV